MQKRRGKFAYLYARVVPNLPRSISALNPSKAECFIYFQYLKQMHMNVHNQDHCTFVLL